MYAYIEEKEEKRQHFGILFSFSFQSFYILLEIYYYILG